MVATSKFSGLGELLEIFLRISWDLGFSEWTNYPLAYNKTIKDNFLVVC